MELAQSIVMIKFCLGVIVIAIITSGCDRSVKVAKRVEIDPEFQQYVDSFVTDAKSVGRTVVIDDLKVLFDKDLDQDTLGLCYDLNEGTAGVPTIYINYNTWPYWTNTEKKVVLYHEMGHCVLWRGHDENLLPSGDVESIMYPSYYSDSQFINNWNYYITELFTIH